MDENYIKSILDKKEKSKNRQKIYKLIELILAGKINSTKSPLARIFSKKTSPRQEYISPRDRSSYNYGYMDSSEMLAGTPFFGD